MALKNDRYEAITDISFFMDQVAERGGVVCMKTAGSGVAMDQSEAEVQYAAAPSGAMPLGVLLNDMVNKDLTQTHLNFHKNEMQKGSKVVVLLEGFVVTDMITPGVTPTKGQKAYVYESGYISTSAVSDDSGMATAPIGRFLSTKDEDGFCKVYVKMPAS
jgi:hypothetical protein